MKLAVPVLLIIALVSTLSALTPIAACSGLDTENEVYVLTADASCPGDGCSCMNVGANNVTLQCDGFRINGSGLSVFPYNYGINLSSVENVTIKDCRVDDFVYGLYSVSSRFANITNNTFTGDSWAIDLEDSSNNTILNNSMDNAYGYGILAQTGSDNNSIINNTVRTAFLSSIGIQLGSAYNNLSGNDLSNNPLALMVTGAGGCENYIDASNIAGVSGDPILFVYDSTGAAIGDSASYGEVLVCNVNDSAIRNITMADDNGVILSRSYNNAVQNNSLAGANNAFYLYVSGNNDFYNNTASATNSGFQLDAASNNNTICNSTLPSVGTGFSLSSSNYNHFCNSSVTGSFAVGILSASNNTFDRITSDVIYAGVYMTTANENNVSNLTVFISSSFYGGIATTSGSSGNRFVDIAIYASGATPFAVSDSDGGNYFTNVYLNSTLNNFISGATALSTYTNLTLSNNGSSVNFAGPFAMGNSSNISNTNISYDFVSINTSDIPDLNRSANITTYTNTCSLAADVFSLAGFPSSRDEIMATGSLCPLCNRIACSGNTIQFDVPEFTGYAAGTPEGCANLSDDSTWGTMIVNNSGILYVNDNTTLCTDTYSINTTNYVLWLNASNIYLNCNQSVLDGVDGLGVAIVAPDMENDTIENCTITRYGDGIYLAGTNSSRVAFNNISQAGIGINLSYGANRNSVLNNTIMDSPSYAIRVGLSNDNYIYNNTGNNSGAQGFLVENSNNTHILDNSITNATYENILIRDGGYNEVAGNTVRDCQRWACLLIARETGDNVTNNVFAYNHGGAPIADIYLDTAPSTLVQGNQLLDGAAGGLYATTSNYLIIADNIISNNSGIGVYATTSNYLIIADNIISNNTGTGVYLVSSNGSTLDNNTASGNGNGFYLYLSNDTILSNNTAHSGPGFGFRADSSSGNNFTDTVAYNNSDYGLYLTSASAGNNFTNMFIYNQSSLIFQGDTASPANNFTNLTLGYNASIGLLNYQFLNLTYSDIDSTDIILDPYFVSLNDATAPEADRPANITVYTERCNYVVWKKESFPRTRGDIQANGTIYTPSYRSACVQAGTANPVTFDVGNFTSATEMFSGYTLGAYVGCVNLSDEYTYGDYIVNDSGTLDVNQNTTLCRDTYYMNVGFGAILLFMNSSGIHLDCNESMIDGVDGEGIGVQIGCTGLCSDIVANDTVRNCTAMNYATGFYVVSSSGNTLLNNTAFNNSAYGFGIESSDNNTLLNNIAANTSAGDGFYSTGGSLNNFTSCTAYGNAGEGFSIVSASNYNNIMDCTSYDNTVDGFYVYQSTYDNFTNNIARNNTVNGFYLTSKVANRYHYHYLANNTAYGNSESGFYLNPSSSDTLENNTAYENTLHGFFLSNAFNNTLAGNIAYDNIQHGFYLLSSHINNLTDSEAYGNGGIGAYLWYADNATIGNITFYGNGYDFAAASGPPVAFTYNVSDALFLNPSGTLEDYTTLGIDDSVEPITIYWINWSSSPEAAPTGISFEDKFVNITNVTADVSIDHIEWKWSASEASGYEETSLTLWKYDASWAGEPSIMDTGNHLLYVDDLVPSSVYGIFGDAATTPASQQNGNPSSDVPLSIIADEEVPTGTLLQITVEHEGHVTLPNAHVVITFGTDTVFTGYTDSWGMVSFTPTNAGLYSIRASKLGYVAANDTFTAVAPTECASSNDCAEDERCSDGICRQIPEGNCGIYSNHTWEDYACCASSDCGEGYSCTEHECVQKPEEPETGCTIDTQCQQGYMCASGTCVPKTTPPECTLDSDCLPGFACNNTVCVQMPAGPVTEPTPEPPKQSILSAIVGTILNLWWLWIILVLLAAWYIYKKGREKKA